FDELAPEHLAALAALDREIILLGTGARQRFPSPEIMRSLLRSGVGVEVMDVQAACRTYNILLAEDRRVAAALLIGWNRRFPGAGRGSCLSSSRQAGSAISVTGTW